MQIQQTFPYFPGNEGNYLRAQIARITATTLISPIGYFTFENFDESDKEEIKGFIFNIMNWVK